MRTVCYTDYDWCIYKNSRSNCPFHITIFIYNACWIITWCKNWKYFGIRLYIDGINRASFFSEGGGFAYVLKPSFGYIIGFAVATFVTGKIANSVPNPSYKRLLIANFTGLFIVYLFGMIYYYMISNFYLGNPIGLWTLFLYCFILAIPGDILLCIIGAVLGKRLIPLIKKNMV